MLRPRQYAAPEAELVQRVADFIRPEWDEVYHSVRFLGYEIDLVAVRMRGDELQTLCVEAKQSMNPEVFGKCLLLADWSTYVLVAAPHYAACADTTRFSVVGYYTKLEARASVHTGAKMQSVRTLAEAARKSSTGQIAPGGKSSPIAVKKPDLEAEKLAQAMKQYPFGQRSMEEMLPHLTANEREDVAAVLRSKRGRHLNLQVRDFGADFLVSRKY